MQHGPRSHVFIVTYGRSGSTVLQNLLNRLPGYLIRGENDNALMHLARSWASVAVSRSPQSARARGQETDARQPWFGIEAVDPEAYGRELAALFTRTFLRPGPDTRVCGFKEIRWHMGQPLQLRNRPFLHIQLDFMRRFFPGAKFVFNTRDLDAVLASGWWPTKNQDYVRQMLERAHRLYGEYQDAHPELCLALDYDAWKADPDAFGPLFEFLGEPFDRALVEQVLDDRLTHLEEPWQVKTGQGA